MQKQRTLYEPSFEHDNCGIGAVVNIDGSKTHAIVDNALSIVEKLEHRAGKDASGETGDGVGILVQISHDFLRRPPQIYLVHLANANTELVSSFFRRITILKKSVLKNPVRTKDLNCLDGVRFLLMQMYLAKKRETACLRSGSALLKSLLTVQRGWILTGNCIF